jgi:salicylate hydroxylase
VIVGAGIGGLTLALLLRRRGIVAEVLEQAPELREVGAAAGLSANATRVLQHLDLGEGLAQLSTEPSELIHRDGRDGHKIATHPVGDWYRRTFGGPWCGMHRIALQQLLGDAWGPVHLHLACEVVALEERDDGIRVRCASGARFDADLAVGADGVHSQMRRWITGGDEPIYSSTSGFRGLVPAERRYEDQRRIRTRQVQLASWATSAVLHLPDGPAAQRRDADLARLPERLAWIHGHDVLARSRGSSPRRSGPR